MEFLGSSLSVHGSFRPILASRTTRQELGNSLREPLFRPIMAPRKSMHGIGIMAPRPIVGALLGRRLGARACFRFVMAIPTSGQDHDLLGRRLRVHGSFRPIVALRTTRQELGSCFRVLASFIIIIALPRTIQDLGFAMAGQACEMHALYWHFLWLSQLFVGDFTEPISPVLCEHNNTGQIDRSGLRTISRPRWMCNLVVDSWCV
jgi:hypothetical protein